MKKTNFVKFIYEIRTLSVIAIMLLGFYTNVSGQALFCNNNIQVSVDGTCSAVIMPDMILEGTYIYSDFTVSIDGGGNIVNPGMIGLTLPVTVTHVSGNYCWGSIVIEDKIAPTITCTNVTIGCDDPLPAAPSATDACGTATVSMISEVSVDNGCTGAFSETITRIWEATDPSGNTATCTQTISRQRATFADILFPPNATIDCTDDANAIDPVTGLLVTGEPSGAGCSNIIITKTDQIVPICSGSYKVLRTWKAVDWCASNTSNQISILQIIKLLDSTPPVVTDPGSVTVGTTSNACAGNVFLPSLIAVDDCSTVNAPEFSLGGSTIQNGILTNAPVGLHTIDYTVEDDCGNVATGSFQLEVTDNIAPIAICDEFTTIGIGTLGTAYVPAVVFDDGSYDNCAIVSMDVRRMTDPCNSPPDLTWKSGVEFCCADVGNTVAVQFRITDASGNSNSCMVQVEIENNTPPSITCPASKTISCTDDYTNTSLTGVAIATSDCGNMAPTFVDNLNLNACGIGTINRIWSVGDGSNNSASCVQLITVLNADPFYINPIWDLDPNDDVVWPIDYETPSCIAGLDPEDLPTPYNEPVITAAGCGDIVVTHDDLIVPIQAPGCIKILRTWIVIDWCQYDVNNPTAGGRWEYVQVVKVINGQAPTVNCGNSDSYIQNVEDNCGAAYVNLFIDADDDCTASGQLAINYSIANATGNVISTGTGNNASDAFNNGEYTITWEVADGCGNVQSCSHVFTVVDAKKPTPVCLTSISTVVMPSSGSITLPASTFESGSSFDNCTAYNNLIFSYSSDVTDLSRTFTCDDVLNSPTSVEIWVTDSNGNQDFCVVQISIQDTNGVCGANGPLTVSCVNNATIQNSEPNCGATFVNLLVNANTGCTQNQGSLNISYVVKNSAGVTINTGTGANASQSFNNGSYTVTFTVEDGCGNVEICTHSFTVVDASVPTAVCPTSPTVTLQASGSVSVSAATFGGTSYDNCTSFNDLIFSYSSNVNNTNRTFTCADFDNSPVSVTIWVTDSNGNQSSCTTSVVVLDPNLACGGSGPLTLNCSNNNTTIQNFDPNCGPTNVSLVLDASTGCILGNMDISYIIQNSNGVTINTGTGANVSESFNNGTYTIKWTVQDGCGNVETCTHTFTVVDAVAPTPVCPSSSPTVTLPVDGSTVLWASDFDSGAFDNCTASSNLIFSFSSDVTDTNIDFTCNEFLNNNPFTTEIWVTDGAGNQAFCTTSIIIEDPSGACNSGPGPLSSIEPSGVIETEGELEVENVSVNLDGSTMAPLMTSSTGAFTFGSMSIPAAGTSYVVRPEKNMNPINGVTTFDLVLISKHILGTEALDSPYKEIAADANNSETITTFDIVVLRRLILQIDFDFPGTQKSWRFVEAAHTFPNGTFPFPEVIDASTMQGGVDFIGVKIGDVNNSASPNNLLGTDTRSFAGNLVFELEDKRVEAGEQFTVDFKVNDLAKTLGYQYTLGFDNTKIDFVDVETNLTNLEESNFGFTMLEEGFITTSWNNDEGVDLENNSALFSLTFTASETANISELFNINSRYTQAEAYAGTPDDSELYNVVLSFNGEVATEKFELFQNTPNPFKGITKIGFNLPEAANTTLKIYDVSGKVLKMMELEGVKGFNSVEINRVQLGSRGVLYYQLETANHTATKKMILVD